MNQDIRNQIDKFRQLNESMGVPENTIPTVTQIYDDITKQLTYTIDMHVIGDEDQEKSYIRGKYTIGAITYDTIELVLRYKSYPELDDVTVYRFSVSNSTTLDQRNDKYQMSYENENPEITIWAAGPENSIKVKEIGNKFISDKKHTLGVFAHEMLHKYEKNMMAKGNRGASISKYAEYNSYGEGHLGIKPIDQMLFYLYFTSDEEKITRPAELLAMLTHDKVTKNNFVQEVKNSDLYKQLVRMKNFNLDDMINDLKTNYVNEVENVFDDPDYRKLPFDEKIDAIFRSLYIGLAQSSVQTFGNIISPNPFDMFTGEMSHKMKTIEKYSDKHNKQLKNFMGYFRKKQTEINKSADETIKKLFKLYDQVPDNYEQQQNDQNNSIRNLEEWNLYHEIRKTPKPPYNHKKND